MKKYKILICASFMVHTFCMAQVGTYHISGTLKGNYYGKIYMFFENNFKQKDSLSSEIRNGNFYFTGKSHLPVLARFHMGQQVSFIQDIYIDNSNIDFVCSDTMIITNNNRDTLNRFIIQEVTGSHLQDLISEFYKDLPNDTTQIYNEIYFKHLKILISKNPYLLVSPYLVSKSTFLNYSQLEDLKNLVDISLENSYEYKTMLYQMNHSKKTSQMLDSSFHNVTLKDYDLHNVNTKDFINKYTLIVFWASWCVPCRNEHADLNNIYSLYNQKGLTILGISLDNQIKKWKAAIKYDKLTWPQMIDTNAFEGEISKYYAINAIPYNILVDSKGIIVAKSLSVPEMYALLKKKFN